MLLDKFVEECCLCFPFALWYTFQQSVLATTVFTVLLMPAATCIVSSTSVITADIILHLFFYWTFVFVLKQSYWIFFPLLALEIATGSECVGRGMPFYTRHHLHLVDFSWCLGFLRGPLMLQLRTRRNGCVPLFVNFWRESTTSSGPRLNRSVTDMKWESQQN